MQHLPILFARNNQWQSIHRENIVGSCIFGKRLLHASLNFVLIVEKALDLSYEKEVFSTP